jgi:hypothetical protein
MPENSNPDVIYLESDSEITEAIDKLKASDSAEVRIAVPARSTILQSAINLKLLKKAATSTHKKLVVVSADKATVSMAAGLGILIAKNVKAESSVPIAGNLPSEARSEPVVIDQSDFSDDHHGVSSDKSSSKNSGSFEKKHISLKDTNKKSKESRKDEVNKSKRDSNEPKVPNFMGLNKKIAIFVGIIAGFILLILAYIFLPTAKVILNTKAQKTPINVQFTLDAGTKKSDFDAARIAADQISTTKDLSAQYSASGKKDIGTKASGNITISNCSNSDDFTIPAGTSLSSSGQKFTLNSSVTVPGAKFSSGNCSKAGTVGGSITASANGDSYNISSGTFSITGYDSKVTGSGSTSGGSSKVVTVVTQSDIDTAKNEMINNATESAKQELSKKGNDNQKVFADTFSTDVTNINASAPADSESAGGTVSARVKYSELAAAKSDLDKVFEIQLKTQIPANNQLYQTGSSDAIYTVSKLTSESAQMQAVGNAFYGQIIDIKAVSKEVAGKSKKSAADVVQPMYSQVESVQVESTPALMPYLPFFANRITVEIKVKTD